MPTRVLLALLLSVAATAADEPRFAPPSTFPNDPALVAYAVVPQLRGLLDHAQAAMGVPGLDLAKLAGKRLGDPGLAALDASQPVAIGVFAPSDGAPGIAAWVPTSDPAPYLKFAAGRRFPAAAEGKLVIIANSAETLALARASLKTYAAIAQERVTADARVRCVGDRAWLAYGESVRDHAWLTMARLSAIKRPAGAPDFAPLMRLIVGGLLAVAQDVQDLQVDLDGGSGTFAATVTIAAQPGSALAAALVQPPTVPSAAGIIADGGDLTRAVGTIAPRATGGFVSKLLRRIAGEQKVQIPDAIYAAFDAIALDADGAFAWRTARDGAGAVRFTSVTGVPSAAAGESLAERVSAAIAGGALSECFTNLGIPLRSAVERDVRRSRDLPVRRVAVTVDESVPGDQRSALLAFTHDAELACPEGWIVCAQDPADLDALIERALAPPTAPALNGDLRLDVDLVGMLQASLNLAVAAEPTPALTALRDAMAAVPAGQPISAIGVLDRGGAEWRLTLPLPPLAAAFGAARMVLETEPAQPADAPRATSP